jgi:hypothetical protein
VLIAVLREPQQLIERLLKLWEEDRAGAPRKKESPRRRGPGHE